MAKLKIPQYSDTEIRQLILKYFYDKNKNATSIMGKKSGSAASIKIIRSDLKSLYELTQSQVISNLTYLISQGWIEEKHVGKSFPTGKGTIVPAVTTYYLITAMGMDKIDGPTEFTRDRFSGIKIEATGQNIITLGDGNQINSKFRDLGNTLNSLKDAIKSTNELSEEEKLDMVVDVDSIQDQLAKQHPNKSVIQTLFSGLEKLANISGAIELYNQSNGFINNLLQ